ncbi:unnamed protein product [Clonostachys rosea f. rosea IK726]|uniref:Choline monooxygenase, chloroplastic n=2 Tax=Bionectria ochroleuca TaxID=29856 RepID=A0A0B7KAD8_BIOOC|nr:unnamed protein product [Clonostachys rosea f. rosea IK726]
MASPKRYFGVAPTNPLEVDMTSAQTLSASWFNSQEIYELERRAIFSKKWLMTTHALRIPNSGDWVRYDVAGYDLVICKDNKKNINAFHNVCRHRAFPIVTSDQGHSLIFSCKYHGWSYGLNGKLAKAPGYQDLPDFDKSKNNLFPIHTHVDKNGFIWINLDADEKPEIAWSDDFADVDEQVSFSGSDWSDFAFDHSWDIDGEYNWKVLADSYNSSAATGGDSTTDQAALSLKATNTHFFPNASVNATPQFFFTQRVVPSAATKSKIIVEIFRKRNSSDEEFEAINAAYKRILTQDKDACAESQKQLNSGVFAHGELHHTMDDGLFKFQEKIRELANDHRSREQAAGVEIWPARQKLPGEAKTTENDEVFCTAVNCCKLNKEGNKAPIAV